MDAFKSGEADITSNHRGKMFNNTGVSCRAHIVYKNTNRKLIMYLNCFCTFDYMTKINYLVKLALHRRHSNQLNPINMKHSI